MERIIQPIRKAHENTAHLDIVSLFIYYILCKYNRVNGKRDHLTLDHI